MALHADSRRPSQVSAARPSSGVVTTTAHSFTYEEPVRTGIYCELCGATAHNSAWLGAHRDSPGRWHVPSSDGTYYEVMLSAAGVWTCPCKAAEFRPDPCKHASKVIDLERQGKSHDWPHVVWLQIQQACWPPEDPTLEDIRGSID